MSWGCLRRKWNFLYSLGTVSLPLKISRKGGLTLWSCSKQLLLHLLSAEIILNTQLHGEITCLHSELESWNPRLPHSTIISVISFLNVSDKWQQFFRKFLEAPLKFVEDGPSGQIKKRKRGGKSTSPILGSLTSWVTLRGNFSKVFHVWHDPLIRRCDLEKNIL